MRRAGVPFECRMLLALAALAVPRYGRHRWRDKWFDRADSWWYYNAGLPWARLELLRGTFRAIPDALQTRMDPDESRQAVRHFFGHPLFVAGVLAALICALGVSTHGFRETRAVLNARQLRDPRVVMISARSPLVGYATGVPTQRFIAWGRYQKSLDAYAAYSWSGTPAGELVARVEPSFFDILGESRDLGRAINTDRCADCALATDARRIGRVIDVDGRSYRVVGALPKGFWFASANPAYWVSLDASRLPAHVGVIGRLRPGVSAIHAQSDLGANIVPMTRLRHETAFFYSLGLCLALGVALFRIPHDRAFWAHAAGPLRSIWRFWTFFALKSAALVSLIIVGAIEIRYGLELTPTGARDPVVMAFATWPLLLVLCGAFWWSWADQRLRCRNCVRRLEMPVHMGTLGASLSGPTGVETVCPVGHGALYQPDTPLSDATWITLDEFFSTPLR